MTLTQQFIAISIFPLSFLGMILYLLLARMKRKQLAFQWVVTLLLTAVWASSILRFYGGTTFPGWFIHTWGVVGRYALSLVGLGVLWTTTRHLATARGHSWLTIIIGLLLGGAALGLDPVIWGYSIFPITIAGQTFSSFDLWGAIWVTSWLVPALASWILTRHVTTNISTSLYRNQIHYWQLFLNLFMVGGLLASIQQADQPGWQGAGILVTIIAMLIATVSIVRRQLPDLQLALRQILHRLSGTLIIFGLTWLALTGINRSVAGLPPNSGQNLIFVVAAAGFAVLFTLVYSWVNVLTSRIFLRPLGKRDVIMSDYTNAIGNLPEPEQLAQLFLRTLQANLGTDDGWFFTAEDGPAGKLVIRPLAQLGTQIPDAVDFDYDSPFAQYLRQNDLPLIQHDIDSLPAFDEMSENDKMMLSKWQRSLYMPLRAGDSLIGLLGLGNKYSGDAYDRNDFDTLRALASQVSPLLAQAQNLASLRQINHYVFDQNQAMARDRQHLQELSRLYKQFFDLVTPEMREPFANINRQIQRLQGEVPESKQSLVTDLGQQLVELRTPIDNLITMSARIQKRTSFHFEPMQLNEVAGAAIRNLRTMAEARKVKVEFEPHLSGVVTLGDKTQLIEAAQHLLHNAIKFNKIGGVVKVQCGVSGGEVYLQVVDSGVGVPEDRLQGIWSGFSQIQNGKNGSHRSAKAPGLGLALTHFIISAHSGRVEAESKYGSGSRFGFYLPLVLDE
jgi:signal transduction histidine kinase